jgi:glutamate N-acetyltransferase/amino-acid N-acetyltransferase
MTTDTRPKASLVKGIIDGKEFTLAGIAKGSGMIHPDMATLLVFLFTDAAATPKVLKTLLRQGLTTSFNRITVDGDTSTNDHPSFGQRQGRNAVISAAEHDVGPWGGGEPGDVRPGPQVVADGEGPGVLPDRN